MESGACTLLGPEGPGRLLFREWLDLDSLGLFLMPGCMREGYRPYFENYTVDASILDPSSLQVMDRQDSHGAAFGLRSCKSLDLQLFEL